MKKVFYYLSSLLVLTGCTQETDFFSADRPGDQAGFKFELTTSNTRTVTDDNFKTTFSEGDKVGLFVVSRKSGTDGTLAASGNYADNRQLTYTGGVWIIDREVTYPADGEELDFYAYYPYVENADPTNITYDASKSMCDLMMASTKSITNSIETVTLTFSHQLSLVDTRISGGAASSAVLTGVKTAASFNLGKFGSDDVMTLNSAQTGDVTMEKCDLKHFRAYIPSQDAEGSKIEIRAEDSSQPYSPQNTVFAKGSAYQYNIVSTIQRLADLPNCYIVKPGESVTFPVLKAYDVWRKIPFINGGSLRNDGELGVTLIWQDAQNLIPAEGGLTLNKNTENPDQSTVTVKTNAGISGNALVSVTMGGDKVWSWHIWVTDFDPDKNTTEVDNNGDGITDYVFMDRNLGAITSDITNPGSVGMYYQGGNNCPYPGFTDKFPTDGTAITDVTIYDIDNNPVKITTGDTWNDNQGQAMRRLLTSPGLFITSYGEPYSWITNSGSATLAYGPNFWTVEATGEKGVFDPSPEGWMVPAYKNNLSPWNSYFDDGGNLTSDPTAVYPKGGRMRFDAKFGNCSDVMYFSGSMTGLKNYAFQSGSSWGQITNYSAGNGLNVRCVKVQ